MKSTTRRTYRVRVQEPGSAYYVVIPDVEVEIDGDWIILSRNGSPVSIHPRQCVVYCQTPELAKS